MDRRSFLALVGGAVVLAACGDDDDVDAPTTLPAPGAGVSNAVLLRTGAALSLAAAQLHERAGGEVAASAAEAHRSRARSLDGSVTDAHTDALATWTTPADAELALSATFQAWCAVLSTPSLRRRAATASVESARRYTVLRSAEVGTPVVPEPFQLTDAAVPDRWLLS